MPLSPDRHRAALACCRPDGSTMPTERRLREALQRLGNDPALQEAVALQTEFDEQMVESVQGLPLPESYEAHVEEGLRRTVEPQGTPWRRLLREPAPWAVLLAFLFLAAWAGYAFYQHTQGFSGDDTVRQIIENTRTGRHADHIEPLITECSRLGDTLFLQYGLEGYDVPPPFEHDQTSGYRVFAKNESFVAQVEVVDHDRPMTFLVFRADKQDVSIHPPGKWKFMSGEEWSAAVLVKDRVGFAAVYHGDDDVLRNAVAKTEAESKP